MKFIASGMGEPSKIPDGAIECDSGMVSVHCGNAYYDIPDDPEEIRRTVARAKEWHKKDEVIVTKLRAWWIPDHPVQEC